MVMYRALRVVAILLLILGASCSHPHADENPELTGDHVANITRMFLRSQSGKKALPWREDRCRS